MATSKERMTIYLPGDLIQTLKIEAIKQRVSLSVMVEMALVTACGGEVMVATHEAPRGEEAPGDGTGK